MAAAREQLDLFGAPAAPAGAAPDEVDDQALDVERAAQRPRTRGACLAGGINAQRPCPWVTCPHSLLLELTAPNGDHAVAGEVAGLVVRGAVAQPQPSLLLNRARRDGRPALGRPPTLAPDASKREVAAFEDAAVEQLETMPETCALDVATRRPWPGDSSRGLGNTDEEVAEVLGLSVEAVIVAEAEARSQFRGQAYLGGMAPPATVPRTLSRREGETPEQAIARAKEHAAGTWWPRVADETPEAGEGRWTWQVYELVDAADGLRLAAESTSAR